MAEPGDVPNGGMPRWVKIFLIIGAALALLFVVVMLAGGGEHGPRRHSADTAMPRSFMLAQ